MNNPRFSPIEFDDGTCYTSEEVEIICMDYIRSTERAVAERREASNYTKRWKKGEPGKDPHALPAPLTPHQVFINEVREKGDYDWIWRVAESRNEIEPVWRLRVIMHNTKPIGGSTVEIMMKEYNEICRDKERDYMDMARAKFIISQLDYLAKRGMPNTSPTINVGVGIQVDSKAQADEPKVITIKDVREKIK
jgi:hypothetical protein